MFFVCFFKSGGDEAVQKIGRPS